MFSYLACLRVMAWFEKQSLRYVNSMNWIVIEGMERKAGVFIGEVPFKNRMSRQSS